MVARNGMKICAETEEREREKLNSVSLRSPRLVPSVFLSDYSTIAVAPPTAAFCPVRMEKKRGRERKRKPICVCEPNVIEIKTLRPRGMTGKSEKRPIRKSTMYATSPQYRTQYCFAFRSSLSRSVNRRPVAITIERM